MEKKKLHSEEFFGDSRDFWWNQDFLELMASRWELQDVKLVLDAGCGIGHWGRALEPHLPRESRVIGVDREREWVAKAKERAEQKGLAGRFSYQVASVESLPFPDATFDMVTCQTVLIHVADPIAVLKEFRRVLKPGGLLAVAEPNNLCSSLVGSSLSLSEPLEKILASVRFQAICEKGKILLGEGDSSLGDVIPGYFHQVGLKGIKTYLSDKATQLLPPYEGPEQQSIVRQMREWGDEENTRAAKPYSHRQFIAGGGTEDEFEELWALCMGFKGLLAAFDDHSYHTAGGAMMYLVSGRKGE